MELVVLVLKIFIIFVVFVMSIYSLRHLIFTFNRLLSEQRIYYQDILDDELPMVTVVIPMHNEELVAKNILNRMLKIDYPANRFEVLPINDHSSDETPAIIDKFAAEHDFIRPLHRNGGARGKPSGLNDAMDTAKGDIIIVFDADYLPPRGIVRDIAVSFLDPQIGAVMGRVIPHNVKKNLLTRLLDLERSGGYQVDQQARHNLHLLPQYGGTVGGFRKDVAIEMGGFSPNILTEDTELTYKMFINGYKVIYANRVECYEESPESWNVRARQVQRWAHGHTQVMYKYLWPTIRSRYLSFWEKVDGVLLLLVYTIPVILLLAMITSIALFFMGRMNLIDSMLMFIYMAAYNPYGNFALFYEVAAGTLLDGAVERVRLVPFTMFSFIFNMWYVTKGFAGGTVDMIFRRETKWVKTRRFGRKDSPV
ncbi:MAG: glycosyltransferase family 2 protein [Proteobacteria bacterium]|nr:glycosyltransferase family 2 protein [Pseudomonadota bacterium]